MGLEQSPAYFTTRENSRNRAKGPLVVGLDKDPDRDPERGPHPLLVKEHKESLLAEEILDLHLGTEVDLDLHPPQEYVQTPCGKEE